MTAPVRFRQKDITRAIKAVDGLGFEEVQVTINPDGKIDVTVRKNVNLDELQGQDLD